MHHQNLIKLLPFCFCSAKSSFISCVPGTREERPGPQYSRSSHLRDTGSPWLWTGAWGHADLFPSRSSPFWRQEFLVYRLVLCLHPDSCFPGTRMYNVWWDFSPGSRKNPWSCLSSRCKSAKHIYMTGRISLSYYSPVMEAAKCP